MATVSVIYDEETDDYIVPLGNDVCDELGWQVGDTIKWQGTPVLLTRDIMFGP